jgi:hypothetical protein
VSAYIGCSYVNEQGIVPRNLLGGFGVSVFVGEFGCHVVECACNKVKYASCHTAVATRANKRISKGTIQILLAVLNAYNIVTTHTAQCGADHKNEADHTTWVVTNLHWFVGVPMNPSAGDKDRGLQA